jgi:hypothetical protein
MLGFIAFAAVVLALVAVACWAGRGSETSGKAGDSTGGAGFGGDGGF